MSVSNANTVKVLTAKSPADRAESVLPDHTSAATLQSSVMLSQLQALLLG